MIDKEFEEIIKSLGGVAAEKKAKMSLHHKFLLRCYRTVGLRNLLIPKFEFTLSLVQELSDAKHYHEMYELMVTMLVL